MSYKLKINARNDERTKFSDSKPGDVFHDASSRGLWMVVAQYKGDPANAVLLEFGELGQFEGMDFVFPRKCRLEFE